MSIHAGHRARLRQRFVDQGASALDDAQLLELLLFYALPQGDVNPLAQRLLLHFGSFAAVLDATPEALCAIPGVGPNSALLLSMLPQVLRRYEQSRVRPVDFIASAADAGEYLVPCFLGARKEHLYLLGLNLRGQVLRCTLLAEGEADRVEFDSRDALSAARDCGAVGGILAHNHLSGTLEPSRADLTLTRTLAALLSAHGIQLLDHLIVADGEFSSLAEGGILPLADHT